MEAETVSHRHVADYSNEQTLMLDFEAEFAAFLTRDFPDMEGRIRRRSSTASVAARRTVEVGIDGTFNAADLSYDTLVSFLPKCEWLNSRVM